MESKKVTLTKKLFKATLVELLKTTPLNKITIKELCAKSNLNRSTFYSYYLDIYDLLDDLENDYVSTMPYIITNSKSKNNITLLTNYIMQNYSTILILSRQGNLIEKTVQKSIDYIIQTEGPKSVKEIEYFTLLTHFYIGGLFQALLCYSSSHEYITIHELTQIIYSILDQLIIIRKQYKY